MENSLMVSHFGFSKSVLLHQLKFR